MHVRDGLYHSDQAKGQAARLLSAYSMGHNACPNWMVQLRLQGGAAV